MSDKEKNKLMERYTGLKKKQMQSGDNAETYTTGYRAGHLNGQIELLEQILDINSGTCSEERCS
jgi:hypothetical protein